MNTKRSDVAFKKERKPDEKKRGAPEGRKPERNEKFQCTFIPLIRSPADLVEVVMRKPGVQIHPG